MQQAWRQQKSQTIPCHQGFQIRARFAHVSTQVSPTFRNGSFFLFQVSNRWFGPWHNSLELQHFPDLPFLAFLEFLAFFFSEEFLAFFSGFPFFPRDFRGRLRIKTLLFLVVFLAVFQKNKERKISIWDGI